MKITIALILILFCALNFFAQTAPESSPVPAASPGTSVTSEPGSIVTEPTVSGNSVSRYADKHAPVRISRFDAPPVIDGQLNDAVWQSAALFGDFVQTSPGENVKPTHPTEFMMGYDAKNLYLAFRIFQDRKTVRATVARRDNIANDDYVLVHLDTFNDQRQAYLLFFNPLGIQMDGTFTEGRGEDYSLDIVMESKGVLTEDGFTIEVAIPFKSLRYEAGKDKHWGLHINRRVKYNNNEYNSWMPENRSRSGWLNQAGRITGMEGIETTRQLEINPSLTVSESGRRTRFTFDNDPAGRYVNDGIKADFGFTAKFGLTPTITLDFAYNPDFAQVEADAPVSTANVRFPIFFAEKRPFFLERIDIFQTAMNVVNTRAIVDPDVAVKLTGRRGRNTFGVLYASDNAPGNYTIDERQSLFNCQQIRFTDPTRLCGIERFVDKNADIGVLRLKRDIGRQHNLGFFATTYNFTDRHNHTAGFDGRFRLSEKTVAEFQVIGTNTRGNFYDADLNRRFYRTGNGFGYRANLQRSDRNWFGEVFAVGRTKDYAADVGFTPRVDTNQIGTFLQYITDRDAKKSIIYKRINTVNNITFDWRGRAQNWISSTAGLLALQRQTFVGLGFQYGYERVFEHEYGATRTATRPGALFGPEAERSANFTDFNGFIETTPNKKIYAFATFDYKRGQLDYDLGNNGRGFPRISPAALLFGQSAPYDPGAGNQLTIQSGFRYQPTTAFQTRFDYTKRRLVRRDNDRVAFDDNIFSSRSIYQFNRDIFARLRIDYSTLRRRIQPQFVLGWTPSPGTALYAGYNDDINYRGYNPYTGTLESGFRGNGRTFFIKASYLFRKSF
ncbi:MAG: carbohydrate binding family 9 domain-containing protein [Acidobacteriota bacterium]|nr:carbohydrate binding family 9 domain-containing protein [Acidobacteriota bacterium]